MAHADASLRSGHIRYRTQGAGPPLVLVSTLGGTWMRQVAPLSEHFTVLTYDMRGFGDSEPPVNGEFPSNTEHADDLAQLLDALELGPASVVGLSHGGHVAQHFALRHPDRLRRLGLVATFARPENATRILLKMLFGFLERDDLPNFWEVLKSFLFTLEGGERLLRAESLLRQAMFDQYTVASLRSIYGQAQEHDCREALAEVRSPTLVIGGSEDLLFPPALSRELAQALPDAQLELLPTAHIPPVEAPQLFNKALLGFFKDAS